MKIKLCKETKIMSNIRHQSLDLFEGAQKWAEKPRFFLPQPDGSYQPVSWQQYAQDVRALGGFLSQDVASEAKVAMLGQTSYAWIVAYCATQSISGVVVPIYPASKGDMISYFLQHSEASVLLCDASFLPVLAEIDLGDVKAVLLLDSPTPASQNLKVPVTGFAEALAAGQDLQAEFESAYAGLDANDLATIIYTSGTTGLPKGVMLTHKNLQASAQDWISLNGPHIPQHAVDLHWLPLAHAFGIGAIMLGNRLGWQSYFADPRDVLDKMQSVKPHTFLSVPAYWEKLYLKIQAAGADQAAYDAVTGGRLSFGLSGGAGLKKEIKEGFHKLGLLIIEGYGLTECSPTLTMNRRERFNFDSVGVPYPSVEVKLAEDGEILAKGPNIFAGYYKNEAATQEAFDAEGWFKTGDVGRWTDDGFLQIIDRKKEILVTSGGKNVPPQNIERRFQDNPYIQHLIVFGDGQKYLTAMVTLEEGAVRQHLGDADSPWAELLQTEAVQSLVDAQIQAVNQELASFESLKKVWINPQPLTVEDNLLTASLKPRRKAIYERYGAELEKLYA